jgi:hypothetical protein
VILGPAAFNRVLSLGGEVSLIARGLQLANSVVQHGVGQIGDAMFQNAGSVVFILLVLLCHKLFGGMISIHA